MAKKVGIAVGIAIAAVAISMTYGAIANPGGIEEKPTGEVWKFRFSGPEWEDKGGFRGGMGILEKGYYEIRFVPMGDSPSKIIIDIEKMNYDSPGRTDFGAEREFFLDRDLVDTGISKYYTWEYNGEENFSVKETGDFEIYIGREGNLKGSVTVSVYKVDRSI